MRSCFLFIALAFFISCNNNETDSKVASTDSTEKKDYVSQRLAGYATVRLTSDLNHLSESDKKVIPLLIEEFKKIIKSKCGQISQFRHPISISGIKGEIDIKEFDESLVRKVC